MHVVCQFLQMFPRIWKGGAGRIMMLEVQLKECMCYHNAITQSLFSLSSFISPGDRNVLINDTNYQADFKSHQWFGATVRSHGDTILVR